MTDHKLSDGTPVLIGLRVFRAHPHDGTRRGGTRRGPMLTITTLRPHKPKDGPEQPNAIAVLKQTRLGHSAGTEFVWNLRRAHGWQPDSPKTKTRAVRPPHQDVSSIRIPHAFREELIARGDEITTVIRRDLSRLYDLLTETRARLQFPAGTLAVLAQAWTMCAPPPPQNTLRPQWFVPLILDACRKLATPEASALAQYAASWGPLEAYAVQDAVERWTPEVSSADRLHSVGLQECPPDATRRPQKRASAGDKE